ncbi:restriction endonuclease [Streptomyces sp. R35]|uniref:Restriction endonuclease n=1 Tax=Streptomyces sp. R35 TaxID=3238630 RepID=A0AB39SH36_9ACTN
MYLNAGAGGQIVGLSQAGFSTEIAVEPDLNRANTLRLAGLPVLQADIRECLPDLFPEEHLDLLYARNIGSVDGPRDDTPALVQYADRLQPRVFILESDAGIWADRHHSYREWVRGVLESLGYSIAQWATYDGREYGAASPWSASFLVAMRSDQKGFFNPPKPEGRPVPNLYSVLAQSMRQRFEASGDPRFRDAWQVWTKRAERSFSPRLIDVLAVGGEADALYPNDVNAWRGCGIEIRQLADDRRDPEASLYGPAGPCLTLGQAALLRDFPRDWTFAGSSRDVLRQIVESTPPSVPRALGHAIADALQDLEEESVRGPSPAVDLMTEVDALHHSAFEHFIADLLQRDGYRVQKAGGGAGDGGIDVHAVDPLGYPVIVQCKHFQDAKPRVGSPVARNLFGAASARHPLPRALLVTNTGFTVECMAWARDEQRLILVGRRELRRWAIDGLPLPEALHPAA